MFGLKTKKFLIDWKKTQAKKKNICYNTNGDNLEKEGGRMSPF